ncbi:MAG: hypothetical protein L6R28_00405 [Planctomycetes bacterium]|nr:hypothetical protein [Planctomycetota bacterium]
MNRHRSLSFFTAALLTLVLVPSAVRAGDASEPAGELEVRNTYHCIGLRWDIKGDDNQNATCTVQYRRKGTEAWRAAYPLQRVKYNAGEGGGMNNYSRDVNILAGSIFWLAPGTTYEVKLALTDADGGNTEKTLETTTQAIPHIADDAVVVRVKPGELAAKQVEAKPGTVFLLEKGHHGVPPPINTSGAEGKYIVYTGEGNAEATFDAGFSVQGNFVWIDNVAIDGGSTDWKNKGKTGINVRKEAHDVVVSRCRIKNSNYCVHVYGYRSFNVDNWLEGDRWEFTVKDLTYPHPDKDKQGNSFGGEGVDFNHDPRGVGVAAFNDVHRTADGFSYGDNNIDIYNNTIYEVVDDLIEADYGWHNYRMWGNRAWRGLVGMSWQPFNGGPWYLLRNQIYGNGNYSFKLKDGRGVNIAVGNTFVQTGTYKRLHMIFSGNSIWANNIWARLGGGNLGKADIPFDPKKMQLMNHNAYATGAAEIFKWEKGYKVAELQAVGLDKNSIAIDPAATMENIPTTPEEQKLGHGKYLTPKDGSPLIDGGMEVPNLSGPYLGKAPDIGATDRALGPQWTGPRAYTAEGLAYGLPEGWKVAPAAEIAKCADLGAALKPEAVKLLLVRENPRAYIAVSFAAAQGDERWKALDAFVDAAKPADSAEGKNDKLVYFYDHLAARVTDDGKLAALKAAQVEPDGVWTVSGGAASADLAAVRGELFTIVTSLQQTIDLPQKPLGQ